MNRHKRVFAVHTERAHGTDDVAGRIEEVLADRLTVHRTRCTEAALVDDLHLLHACVLSRLAVLSGTRAVAHLSCVGAKPGRRLA